MGKKKRTATASEGPNYGKAVDRAFRRLALPDGRTYAGWRTAGVQKLGEDVVGEFDAIVDQSSQKPDGTSALAEWCALDFDRARYLYAGWYSAAFLAQARWLAAELGHRVAGQANPLLVEVGSGVGTVGAVLGAALRVPVLALDPMLGTASCAQGFAELTGAEVEAHEASVEDLPALLAGRVPTALYGVGVLRYLQRHRHREWGSYSHAAALEAARRGAAPTPAFVALLQAARGVDVLALEVTCADWLGELDAASGAAQYHVEVPSPGRLPVVVTDEHQEMRTLLLTSGLNESSALDLLDGYAGYGAQEGAHRFEGHTAEVARLRRGDVDLIQAVEVGFPDGTLRLEVAGSAAEWWLYQSSTQGYRVFLTKPSAAAAQAGLDAEVARYAGTRFEVRPLALPATRWR